MSKPANTPVSKAQNPSAPKATKQEGRTERTEQEMKDRATEPEWYGVTSF